MGLVQIQIPKHPIQYEEGVQTPECKIPNIYFFTASLKVGGRDGVGAKYSNDIILIPGSPPVKKVTIKNNLWCQYCFQCDFTSHLS